MSKDQYSKGQFSKNGLPRQGPSGRGRQAKNVSQPVAKSAEDHSKKVSRPRTNKNFAIPHKVAPHKQEQILPPKPKLSRINPHQFLYGTHAVNAALNNPNRVFKVLYVTPNRQADYEHYSQSVKVQTVSVEDIDHLLPEGAVHQGVALYAILKDIKETQDFSQGSKPVVILDGITDPQNIGSILRTAAAFGIEHLIMQEKGSPDITGAMAKAAAGAIEYVRIHKVVNLSRAIEELKKNKYTVYAADGESELKLNEIKFPEKTVIVMGAEGNGLRRLVKENCDFTFGIPISSMMESLNVSNAFSIILYSVVAVQ